MLAPNGGSQADFVREMLRDNDKRFESVRQDVERELKILWKVRRIKIYICISLLIKFFYQKSFFNFQTKNCQFY
jgi:hypothetical protein